MSNKPCIIIGGGLFGLSTARQILKVNPDADLTIFSYHQPEAPSYDIAKIFRIDYPFLERMRSCISTRDNMVKDEVLKPFFRPVGRIVAWNNLSTLNAINECRTQLGLEKRQLLDVSVLKQFYDTICSNDGRVYTYQEDDMLIEWEGLMKAMVDDILKLSKKSKAQTMQDILVEKLICKEGQVTELIFATGDKFDATNMNVILAAGPWISDVLDRSGICQPHSSRVPVAAAIFSYILQIPEEQTKFWRDKPIISHHGVFEFTPPIGGKAKITHIMPFTNRASDSSISRPTNLQYSSLAIQCLSEVEQMARIYIPALRGVEITEIKSCWDGITASQRPLIATHPEYRNLTIVGGGSFNHAKDVYIGQIAVDVINGERAQGCGWDAIESSTTDYQPLLLPPTGADFKVLEQKAERDSKVKEWQEKRAGSQNSHKIWWEEDDIVM